MSEKKDGILLISENRKARFEYEIIKTYEAGMQLMGSEVKSARDGQVQLKDSYVSFRGDEAFLQKSHIAVYTASSYNNHEPERLRKLLLNRNELNQIMESLQEKGLSCIPLKMYFKKGRAKLEIALARGKKTRDKRESIKKREVDLEMKRSLGKTRSR